MTYTKNIPPKLRIVLPVRKQSVQPLLVASCMMLVSLAAAYAQSDNEIDATSPNLVKNGSLENTRNTWLDTNCNYMSLTAGSTAIPRWTVLATNINEIVWAQSPTCDGFSAARGTFFVDLTGFGADSSNGAIQQTLSGLTAGSMYLFSMDNVTDGAFPAVTIDGIAVKLYAGKPFMVGNTAWTPLFGIFTATMSNPVLTIQNQQTGQQINFIDNIAVRLH